MNRRLAAFVMTAATAALALGVASLHTARRAAEAQLAEVRGRLASGDWVWLAEQLEDLSGRLGTGPQARTGLGMVAVLLGKGSAPALDPRHVGAYPVGPLLQRALREERYEESLRLTELLGSAGSPAFPDYRAAALIEPIAV
ncbi:MAG: hypothetical protein R3190_12505, partial [Thermoanaerobaculia bacterium]|nr:hypothetical protein [Thermoanaerobaculia bacterium]